MDANTIIQMVGSLGFPICACVAMAYFFSKVNDNYRNDIKEMNASHKEEMAAMTAAINNNTIVIQKLVDKMDKDGE